jgi:hypothetical protein
MRPASPGGVDRGLGLRGVLDLWDHDANLRKGSVALSLCTTAHPLQTIFTKIIGTSISEMAMQPNPTPTAPMSRAFLISAGSFLAPGGVVIFMRPCVFSIENP